MKEPLIFGIGEIVWDCIVKENIKNLGGAPVNFTYYAGKLGAESYPVSAVGNDDLGKETLEKCRNLGISTDYIMCNELPTSRVLINLDEKGVPVYEIVEGVAWDALQASPEVLDAVSKADAICWGSLAGRNDASFRAISQLVAAAPEKAIKVFDINIRQNYYSKEKIEHFLKAATVLKLNEGELLLLQDMFSLPESLPGAITKLARDWGLDYIIHTLGENGSDIYNASGLVSHTDSPKVHAIDTVGAGDSFTAAFVTSLLLGKSISEAHAAATELSAKVCTCKGAIIP